MNQVADNDATQINGNGNGNGNGTSQAGACVCNLMLLITSEKVNTWSSFHNLMGCSSLNLRMLPSRTADLVNSGTTSVTVLSLPSAVWTQRFAELLDFGPDNRTS